MIPALPAAGGELRLEIGIRAQIGIPGTPQLP